MFGLQECEEGAEGRSVVLWKHWRGHTLLNRRSRGPEWMEIGMIRNLVLVGEF